GRRGRGAQRVRGRLPVRRAARRGRPYGAARRTARRVGGAVTSSELFAPPPPASHTDLYAPFAAAVEALRRISCDAVARTTRRMGSAGPEDSLQSAAGRRGWRKVGAPAVLQEGRLVGALSEDDRLRVTAQRLGELGPLVTNVGDALVLWRDVLDGLRVPDVMS